jgi:hypothetical protein
MKSRLEFIAPFSGPAFHPPIKGTLLAILEIEFHGQRRIQYVFRQTGDRCVVFFAVGDLERIIRREWVGTWMIVKRDALASRRNQFSVWTSSARRWFPRG